MNARRALALAPNHRRAHNNLGLVLAHAGRWEDALTEFRSGTGAEADAHLNLAFVLALERHWPEARTHYEHAQAVDPSSVAAKKGLASLDALMTSTEREALPSRETRVPQGKDPHATRASASAEGFSIATITRNGRPYRTMVLRDGKPLRLVAMADKSALPGTMPPDESVTSEAEPAFATDFENGRVPLILPAFPGAPGEPQSLSGRAPGVETARRTEPDSRHGGFAVPGVELGSPRNIASPHNDGATAEQ
jgi:hypothetical protein